MKYENPSFTVPPPNSDEYRDNWDRIFGGKAEAEAEAPKENWRLSILLEHRERLLEELRSLQAEGDEEIAHVKADDILLELVGDLRVTEAFNAIRKWYA